MGALPLEGGVAVAFGREIEAAEDPEAKRRELEDMMAPAFRRFLVRVVFAHDIIDPRETRPMSHGSTGCGHCCCNCSVLTRFTINPSRALIDGATDPECLTTGTKIERSKPRDPPAVAPKGRRLFRYRPSVLRKRRAYLALIVFFAIGAAVGGYLGSPSTNGSTAANKSALNDKSPQHFRRYHKH